MNYIIDFKNNVSEGQINEYLFENNLAIVKTYNNFEKVYLVSGNSEPVTHDFIESVVLDDSTGITLLENIDIVAYDTEQANIDLSEDNNWWKISVLKDVNFDQETQTLNKLGSRVVVYLLDSGVNASHSEFANNRVVNLFSFNNDFTDTKGHGTALASVITGTECGISNTIVKSVKIFDTNQPTLQSDLLSAFDSVVDDYILNNQKPSIVNLSWSIAKNTYIENKIQTLISLGLNVLCAAGNSGIPISDVTPASMTDVIKVGAYNQNFEPCNFSNYIGGSIISVTENQTNYTAGLDTLFGWAPGELIYSAKLDGTFGYAAGTSMSCAIASAVLANNIDSTLTDDEIYGVYISKYLPRFCYNMVFNRYNVLQLSSTYQSTRNAIATIDNDIKSFPYDDILNEYRFTQIYDRYFKIRLCDGNFYNEIIYNNTSSIPGNVSFSYGFLYGTISKNIGSPDINQYVIPITLKNSNNQESIDLTVTITVADSFEQLKITNYPLSSIDPAITINLKDDACCNYYNYPTGCIGTSCIPACVSYCDTQDPYLAGCDGLSKAECKCYCQCYLWSAGVYPCSL